MKINEIIKQLDIIACDLHFLNTDGTGWTDEASHLAHDAILALKDRIEEEDNEEINYMGNIVLPDPDLTPIKVKP